jgi:hypothetical protein
MTPFSDDPETMDKGGLRHRHNSRDTRIVALSAAGGIDGGFLMRQKQVTPKANYQGEVFDKGLAGRHLSR